MLSLWSLCEIYLGGVVLPAPVPVPDVPLLDIEPVVLLPFLFFLALLCFFPVVVVVSVVSVADAPERLRVPVVSLVFPLFEPAVPL
jgi:hypothetical protein